LHANIKHLEICGLDKGYALLDHRGNDDMKIRSTYFCNPKYPLNERVLQKAGTFLAEAKSAYEAAGYEVQMSI
jgi:hypothetical protein